MASTYLTYTQSSPSTAEGQKFTLSMWVKKSKNGSTQGLWGNTYSNTHRGYIYFSDDDTLRYYDSAGTNYATTHKFRDPSGWYHIVVAVDTTLATSGDRIKMYKNGERITNFGTATAPSQNDTMKLANTTNTPTMGRMVEAGTSYYFDGIISHAHLTQGYVYDATPFGETDSTTGNWKIKTAVTGVTYGTNGFWWLKDSIATTDHSSNSNAFSVAGGTLTKTEDCPDNVFATFSPLNHDHANANATLQNANTLAYGGDNNSYNYSTSTLGMPKGNGKFYFEAKYISYDGVEAAVGIVDMDYVSELFFENRPLASAANSTSIGRVLLNANGRSIIAGTENASYGFGSWANNDIICMACDMENGAFYFRKNNGSWANSGDPTSGSTRTGAIDIHSTTPWDRSTHWGVWAGDNETGYDKFALNTGNGYFGTTAVSSAGTNASGIGIFEYNVPAGYTALSTKGLNL